MNKGFTLVESMIVMLLISFTLILVIPSWQYNQEKLLLQKEEQRLILFLKQIQAIAETTNQSWSLMVSKDHFSSHWCLLGQKQHSHICDCLHLEQCPTMTSKQAYYPKFATEVQISATKYYPQVLTFFNGKRNLSFSARIQLKTENYQRLISFNNLGNIKLKQE